MPLTDRVSNASSISKFLLSLVVITLLWRPSYGDFDYFQLLGKSATRVYQKYPQAKILATGEGQWFEVYEVEEGVFALICSEKVVCVRVTNPNVSIRGIHVGDSATDATDQLGLAPFQKLYLHAKRIRSVLQYPELRLELMLNENKSIVEIRLYEALNTPTRDDLQRSGSPLE